MMDIEHHYVDGELLRAREPAAIEVRCSHTEEVVCRTPAGTIEEATLAVDAAARAFESWSAREAAERARFVVALGDGLAKREKTLAAQISREVGMPVKLAEKIQIGLPVRTLRNAPALVAAFLTTERVGTSLVVREPHGVVVCITPWNYPLHQIAAKIAPALVAGNTVVLKPSEVAPASAVALIEVAREIGLPPGVLNVIFGDGSVVGEALVSDLRVDMVSFTGSTRAGRRVSEIASGTVKRVALELGGKSASVVMADADLEAAVKATVASCFLNSGQTCSALTRLVVPRARVDEAVKIAAEFAASFKVGDPFDASTRLGPLASAAQRARVHSHLANAQSDGARIVTGGIEAPTGLETGYYVRPTVVADVTRYMRIAQEEVFGPVLAVLAHDGEDDAIDIANSTVYGLAAAVFTGDRLHAMRIARRIRAGQVDLGAVPYNPDAPFGGMKQSGIGREYGVHGLHEFTELKSLQLPA
jgi:aldehyde dehydrogenase (NAD+)